TAYNKIKLTWDDASTSESGFEIVRSSSLNGTYQPAGNVGQNITQFVDSTLAAATTYYYKIRSLSATGNSAYSAAASATTDALPGAPAAPGTPTVDVLGSTSVRITFADNSSNETGFEVWRSMGDQNNFKKISTLDPSTTMQVVFNDNGLFANVTYYYRVRALGSGSTSEFSGIGFGNTLNTTPEIAAIANFTMKYGTTFTLPLNGTDADADPLTYQATSLPSFATLTTNSDGSGQIVFNPSSSNQGTFTITAIVTDGKATASATFVLTVNNNSVPQVTPVPDIFMSEGETLTVPLKTTDVESVSQLIWEFQGQPSFATFTKNADGTGSLVLKPGYSNSGVFSVVFKVTDPNGAWTSTPINITVYDKDPNESIQVNFRNFTGGVPSWNDVQLQQTANASPPEPYFVANNLANSVGNNTGVSINVVSGVYKASQNGQVTGLDIGVYPDNVIRDQMNWGWGLTTNAQDTVVLRVSNLSNLRKYDFTFFGSYQTGATTGINTYKIGAASATLLYYQNTTNTATITGVTPDANGQVFITMIGDASTSRGGVLNALVIKGLFQDGTLPAKATNLTGTVVPNAGIRLNWTDRAYNETSYKVYRSSSASGPWTFINTVGTFKDSTTYLDPNVSAFTTYYYYVAAINTFGQAPASDIISVTTGNVAPVITGLANIYVKTDGFIEKAFTVTDTPGDIITVTGKSLPSFVTLVNTGGSNYKLAVTPTSDNIGQTKVTVQVSDNQGGVRTQTIVVNVADKFTRSFFVNLGNLGQTAPLPWTNWLGARSASSKVSALKDENQGSSAIVLTSITKWTGTTNLGMITGNDSGVYPDSVLASGIYYNSTTPMQFRYTGLNPAKRYNIVVMSSVNEGLDATVEYAADTQRDTLDARYNTNRTANLNGLVPDATNGITLTMTKIGSSAAIYVNGIVLEEYDPAIAVINPANLNAEPVDRSSIALTWADRSSNENLTTGFELQRATDSLFTQNIVYTSIPRNKRSFVSTGLASNTKYWFRIRAVSGLNSSEYSNRAKAVTPQSIVYINFNYQLADAASPWNNLDAVPNLPDVFPGLKNQSGTNTGIQLAIENSFNGEFTAGKVTGNNSGVVPDNVLASNFWTDNTQISTMRISGLNQSKRYRLGFIGSSSAPGWFKGDYTATYTIGERTVYLNSWENSTKMVYINNVVPDANGDVLVTFSTTKAAGYGFNAGMVIATYDDPTGGDVVPGTVPLRAANTQVQAVEETDKLVNSSVKTYPNPFVEYVNLDFFNSSSANKVSVEMYDVSGKLAMRKQFGEIPAGFNTIRLNTGETTMTAGIYIMNLSINGKPIKTTKLVKTNK
ncbi:MAG TPA: fibronectin type III domain-containing protein, partial [Flavitalea sp.]|nr:fibronectin type III domain-containing protein [Flavitalea sp.]